MNRQEPGKAFFKHLEAQILKILPLDPTMVTSSWVQCMPQSAQKNSGYITGLRKSTEILFKNN